MGQPAHLLVVAKDFEAVFKYLRERTGAPAKVPDGLPATAKRIHASTYSLITWKFRLGKMPERGRIYVDEIASDALQILPQVMMGFSKTAKLLMRGLIENALRHIYFYDHPVEYTRANQVGKFRVTVAALFDYMLSHPEFLLTEPKFDAIGRLSALYADLSAGVHGRSVRDLETRAALKSIAYNAEKANEDADLLAKCTAAINFLVAIFHHEKVSAFISRDRSLIMHTMPAKARSVWKDHDPCAEVSAARI